MITIHPETPALGPSIETLLDRAFGPGRTAKTSYRYRDGIAPLPGLCFTATQGGPDAPLAGTVRHWPLTLVGGTGPDLKAVLLGPIAVDPTLKATGIGSRLMTWAIDEVKAQGGDVIVLVGDPVYYSRFGFQPAARFGIVMPDEAAHRVQVLPLTARAAQTRCGGIVSRADSLVLSCAA